MVSVKQSDRAERVTEILNELIGAVLAGYWTISSWLKHDGDPDLEFVVFWGVRMSYGAITLNLRKFEDLWTHHVRALLPQGSEAHIDAEWVLEECRRRNLRKTANLFFAHYARGKGDSPLSGDEEVELLRTNQWTSRKELLGWVELVTYKLMSIRDKMIEEYKLTGFRDEEVDEKMGWDGKGK
jgi:hypothetical protein